LMRRPLPREYRVRLRARWWHRRWRSWCWTLSWLQSCLEGI